MTLRITKGVWSIPEVPALSDDERSTLVSLLDGGLTPERCETVTRLRNYAQFYMLQINRMPTTLQINKHRALVRQKISELLLLLADDSPDLSALNQTLRQIVPRFGDLAGSFSDAGIALSQALREEPAIEGQTTATRIGRTAALRLVLWFLHERLETGEARGEWLGLAMGTGAGRGARRLHKFLRIVMMQKVTPDQVRSAMDFLRSPECRPPLGGGDSPSEFGGPLTNMPRVMR